MMTPTSVISNNDMPGFAINDDTPTSFGHGGQNQPQSQTHRKSKQFVIIDDLAENFGVGEDSDDCQSNASSRHLD